MLAVAVIVFREVLRSGFGRRRRAGGEPRRAAAAPSGLAAASAAASSVAMLVAAFTGEIANALDGIGQEVFNAASCSPPSCMLGWHNVWMNRHGQGAWRSRRRASAPRCAPERGRFMRSPSSAALAVLREGSEIVLFVYGIVAAQGGTA